LKRDRNTTCQEGLKEAGGFTSSKLIHKGTEREHEKVRLRVGTLTKQRWAVAEKTSAGKVAKASRMSLGSKAGAAPGSVVGGLTGFEGGRALRASNVCWVLGAMGGEKNCCKAFRTSPQRTASTTRFSNGGVFIDARATLFFARASTSVHNSDF